MCRCRGARRSVRPRIPKYAGNKRIVNSLDGPHRSTADRLEVGPECVIHRHDGPILCHSATCDCCFHCISPVNSRPSSETNMSTVTDSKFWRFILI